MSTSARLILGLAMSLIAPATNPGSPPSTVVIAELFTSEGCSSCPPADSLVRQFADAQPFDCAHRIALEAHVDYRDRLGWRAPFSSAQFSNRQTQDDDRVFRSNAIYTPQLVVDGERECVGSDRSAIRAIVADSIRGPRFRLFATARTEVARWSRAPSPDRWRPLGDVSDRDRTFAGIVDVAVARNWNIENLQIVGVIQERDSRRILGAGAVETSFRPGSDR